CPFMLIVNLCIRFCFFFSSRRRHTRSKRDWSSDVCSSDLGNRARGAGKREAIFCSTRRIKACDSSSSSSFLSPIWFQIPKDLRRSEERRVGKEGKDRWPKGKKKRRK